MRRILVPVLMSAVLLLTGCVEEEPTPKFEAEPEPSAEVAEKPERETAKQYIRRWNEVQNEMHGGDTSTYRELVPDCEQCIEVADMIDGYYAAGGYVKTEGRTIRSIRKLRRHRDQHLFEFKFHAAPTELTEKANGVVTSLDGGEATHELRLRRTTSGWSLLDYSEYAR